VFFNPDFNRVKVFVVIIATILIAMMCSKAFAQMPPARYDHKFPGNLTVLRLDRVETVKRCGSTPSLFRIVFGCALVMTKTRCVVVVSDASWHPEVTLRHEIAHCNGWPRDHPP